LVKVFLLFSVIVVAYTMETASNADEKTYTLAEVKQHTDAKSMWIAIADNVYDVTEFMEEVYNCFILTGGQNTVAYPNKIVFTAVQTEYHQTHSSMGVHPTRHRTNSSHRLAIWKSCHILEPVALKHTGTAA